MKSAVERPTIVYRSQSITFYWRNFRRVRSTELGKDEFGRQPLDRLEGACYHGKTHDLPDHAQVLVPRPPTAFCDGRQRPNVVPGNSAAIVLQSRWSPIRFAERFQVGAPEQSVLRGGGLHHLVAETRCNSHSA